MTDSSSSTQRFVDIAWKLHGHASGPPISIGDILDRQSKRILRAVEKIISAKTKTISSSCFDSEDVSRWQCQKLIEAVAIASINTSTTSTATAVSTMNLDSWFESSFMPLCDVVAGVTARGSEKKRPTGIAEVVVVCAGILTLGSCFALPEVSERRENATLDDAAGTSCTTQFAVESVLSRLGATSLDAPHSTMDVFQRIVELVTPLVHDACRHVLDDISDSSNWPVTPPAAASDGGDGGHPREHHEAYRWWMRLGVDAAEERSVGNRPLFQYFALQCALACVIPPVACISADGSEARSFCWSADCATAWLDQLRSGGSEDATSATRHIRNAVVGCLLSLPSEPSLAASAPHPPELIIGSPRGAAPQPESDRKGGRFIRPNVAVSTRSHVSVRRAALDAMPFMSPRAHAPSGTRRDDAAEADIYGVANEWKDVTIPGDLVPLRPFSASLYLLRRSSHLRQNLEDGIGSGGDGAEGRHGPGIGPGAMKTGGSAHRGGAPRGTSAGFGQSVDKFQTAYRPPSYVRALLSLMSPRDDLRDTTTADTAVTRPPRSPVAASSPLVESLRHFVAAAAATPSRTTRSELVKNSQPPHLSATRYQPQKKFMSVSTPERSGKLAGGSPKSVAAPIIPALPNHTLPRPMQIKARLRHAASLSM